MKVTKLVKAFTSRWLHVYEAAFNHNGKDGKWLFASRDGEKTLDSKPKCAAVVIVPRVINQDGTQSYVLIREFRIPLLDYEWSFPAGLIDENEDAYEAAARELKEETGFDAIPNTVSMSPPIYSSAGLTDEAVRIVFLDCKGTPSIENNETSECIEVHVLNINQLEDLMNGKIKISARTWCLTRGIIGEERLREFYEQGVIGQ